MKKVEVAAVCSNGHGSAPNGRADDEGGGDLSSPPRVSYAAAARKPPSPSTNLAHPFPLSQGKTHFIISKRYLLSLVAQKAPHFNQRFEDIKKRRSRHFSIFQIKNSYYYSILTDIFTKQS